MQNIPKTPRKILSRNLRTRTPINLLSDHTPVILNMPPKSSHHRIPSSSRSLDKLFSSCIISKVQQFFPFSKLITKCKITINLKEFLHLARTLVEALRKDSCQ